MVKFVGVNRPAALLIFVGFCCEGLMAFIPVSLQVSTTVHCDRRVQCCDFIFTST